MLAILDPHYLACHVGINVDSIGSHVDGILEMFRDLREGDLELASSDQLFACLSGGLFPLRDTYDHFLSEVGVDHVNGSDLARIVLRIMESCLLLENLLESEVETCSCARDLSLTPCCECHTDIDIALESTMHSYAAALEINGPAYATFMATTRCPERAVSTRVTFSHILGDEDVVEDVNVHVQLQTASSVSDLYRNADSLALLEHGSRSLAFVDVAVRCAVAQFKTGPIPSWTYHSEFLQQALNLGVTRTPTLRRKFLRACAEIAHGESASDTHWLRVSAGGNANQLKRSGARAWRQDVDQDIHVHYWVMSDGSRQFASIGHHNMFAIPDPEIAT